MADLKISQLTAISVLTPATDVLPVVDVGGVTKKITTNQILGSGGTATLASATITGDLTVDTSTLKVDSTNNRVGIGLVSPNRNLSIFGASNSLIHFTTTATGPLNTDGFTFGVETDSSVTLFNAENTPFNFYVNSTLGMTLNSTGLAVGTASATYKLDLLSTSACQSRIRSTGNGQTVGLRIESKNSDGTDCQLLIGSGVVADNEYNIRDTLNTKNLYRISGISASSNSHLWFTGSATASMSLDTSGNLLVGTTTPLSSGSTIQNLGINRQVLTLKGDTAVSYTSGIWNASTTGDALFQYFATETSLTVRGGISYNRAGGLVAYNTTSDYRAKDIIGPVSNSGSLIDSLKVYVGKMKGATIERPMLIAHEAQEVAPYAVTGVKDEVDADGKDKYQQMDVSSFVPLLIAEIQSLRARVQTLEAK